MLRTDQLTTQTFADLLRDSGEKNLRIAELQGPALVQDVLYMTPEHYARFNELWPEIKEELGWT